MAETHTKTLNEILVIAGIKDGGGYCRNLFAVEKPINQFINLFYNNMKDSVNKGYGLNTAGFDFRSCEAYGSGSKIQAYLMLLLSMYYLASGRTVRIEVDPTILSPQSEIYYLTFTEPGFTEEIQTSLFKTYKLSCVIDCLVCEGFSRIKLLQALTNFGFNTSLLSSD